MRTIRNSSHLPGGVCSRGVPGPVGVCSQGGAWSGGVCFQGGGVPGLGGLVQGGGGIPACTEADPPWTQWQTGVKT